MILTFLSFVARLGALAASIIVLGLNAKFIINRAWNIDLLIYIEAVAGVSALGALIPPYPNFLYELFFGLAWLLAAIFALVVQFFESDCYGFRENGTVGCASYKASTAFNFLAAFAWLGSAFFGGLRILGVIFNVQRFTDRPLYIGGADAEREGSGKSVEGGKLTIGEDKREAKGGIFAIGRGYTTEDEYIGKGKEVLDDDVDEKEYGLKGGMIETKAEASQPLNRKRRKIKGLGNDHIARYFVCYGILGVVLVAAGLPLLLIYGAPAFGEYLVDRTPIPENINVTLLNPSNDSIEFSVLTMIEVPDTLSAKLEPMKVEFFLEDTEPDIIPFATVDLPQLSFGSRDRLSLENQHLKLGDLNQFARLVERVAYNPTFRVAGQARTKVKLGPVNTWVDIYKVVELPGFNNFPNLEIKQISVQSPDEEGYNVFGEVVVENPAPASVTLGEVTLKPKIGDIVLGKAFVQVNDIVPGNNTFHIKGMVDGDAVDGNITKILEIEMPYLRDGLVVASATGDTVVYKGQNLPYWEEAFRSIDVSATRPVKPLAMTLIDNSLGSLLGTEGQSIPFVRQLVGTLVDAVVNTIKGVPEDDQEGIRTALGTVARLALRILSLIGIL